MTTTFDGLCRILEHYRESMEYEDYKILSDAINAIHNAQHAENSHRLGIIIEQRVTNIERFQEWRNDRNPVKAKWRRRR